MGTERGNGQQWVIVYSSEGPIIRMNDSLCQHIAEIKHNQISFPLSLVI